MTRSTKKNIKKRYLLLVFKKEKSLKKNGLIFITADSTSYIKEKNSRRAFEQLRKTKREPNQKELSKKTKKKRGGEGSFHSFLLFYFIQEKKGKKHSAQTTKHRFPLGFIQVLHNINSFR